MNHKNNIKMIVGAWSPMKPDYAMKLIKSLIYLYDNEPKTAIYLINIPTYSRFKFTIINWLVSNNLKGKKLVEFFQNESVDGEGVLQGIRYCISKIEGNKFSKINLTGDHLK